ncbi:exopolyphosphatase [Balneatrix alpica]|uniref:Exopolyphosphatase n=1 Tax=Balneatrix alpica TaxID=75684 RepID=A0ABV5Z8D6_9GAMM|nr:exopolyphosphatase [Balneatrix alpica]
MGHSEGYRLVTRGDFDGLVCAMLLRELDLIDDILLVHPKDMQSGEVAINGSDITANLPYVPACHLAFDHHHSEVLRYASLEPDNLILDAKAPSCARVVYNHFGGAKRFPHIDPELLLAVDKGDSAAFCLDEILNPSGWVLLNFIMDARTGLGRFRNFRISNYQLMLKLVQYCRDHSIEQILQQEDVKERVELYFEHQQRAKEQLNRCVRVEGKLAVLDLREEEVIWATNRFMVYALYSQTNISMHCIWGVKQRNTVFALGKSIFQRDCPVNIGELCLEFGGGGHANAGTCQVDNEHAERVQALLVERCRQD